jgi:hypothetical protein
MADPLRHRQTKGAATDMVDLTPPRHIPTLPLARLPPISTAREVAKFSGRTSALPRPLCRPIAICSPSVFRREGNQLPPSLSHLGSFRTYRGRAIADISGNPQSISPKSGSGYLRGGAGPQLRPAHLFKSAELIMAASGAEHDSDGRGIPSNPSRADARR